MVVVLRGRLLLLLHSFREHVDLAFQQLAFLRVAVAQVIPLKALIIGVEVVGDAAESRGASHHGHLLSCDN